MPTASQHNPTTPKEHDNTSRPSALQRMLPSPISHKSKTLHPRLLRHVRNQPCEIGKARVCHQVRCLMPRHYSMQYRWSGSGRDSGCSPEVRFVITPNIYNHKVVKFDHFKIWVVQHLPRPNKLGGQTPRKAHFTRVCVSRRRQRLWHNCQQLGDLLRVAGGAGSDTAAEAVDGRAKAEGMWECRRVKIFTNYRSACAARNLASERLKADGPPKNLYSLSVRRSPNLSLSETRFSVQIKSANWNNM